MLPGSYDLPNRRIRQRKEPVRSNSIPIADVQTLANISTFAQMDQRPEQHLLHVLNPHLRLHSRSHRSSIHPVSSQHPPYN